MSLDKKIDFAVVIGVERANPNGDPVTGRPRTIINKDGEEFGEISDVCLKRKIRNRLLDAGHDIFVQSNDYRQDDFTDLKSRAENNGIDFSQGEKVVVKNVCDKWLDVRAFGQIFPYKGKKKKDKDKEEKGVSIKTTGPVTVRSAITVDRVEITSMQITKSTNGEKTDGAKASDTMGMKHRVEHGIYVGFGSMCCQLSEKSGFSYEDALAIRDVLPKLFVNDVSSTRPDGSMEVLKVVWWEHSTKDGDVSSKKIHGSLIVNSDGEIDFSKEYEGVTTTVIEGF